MELTIIIPTNRPYSEYAERTVENINSFQLRHSYEIAIVSKDEVSGKNVRWVKEEERKGPIKAFNDVISASDSQYFIVMVDDHIFYRNPSDAVDFVAQELADKRFPIASLASGAPCYNPLKGQLLGKSDVDFDVGRYPLCRFPVFDRRALKELGGVIFHPKLYYHAGDILLGYYMGMNGEPSQDCPVAVRPHNPAKDSSFEVADCEIVKDIIKEYMGGKKEYI